MEETGHAPGSGAAWIVSAACAIALLHFGRPVLEPIAVAGILTLTLAPVVRRIRAFGLPNLAATFVSVAFVAACVVALAIVLASQLADIARELPHYRTALVSKLEQVSAVILRPLDRWETELATLWADSGDARGPGRGGHELPEANRPIPVEVRQPRPGANDSLSKLFTSAWGPVGEAAVVFVLLLFMLLGRDSIRERLIRLAGEREVARTMQALVDTDEGVSRFFTSLLLVNGAFAAVSSLALALLGVPHALLWGALAGVLRFVPYVGVPFAVAIVVVFAAAVEPGWSLALWTAAVLAALEVVVANVIEPNFYGHTMGVAPFGIIVSALFWSALWGPVGLIVSTPLTLCLVVAGRHVKALAPVAILFGESAGSTHALRVYQRALAGDAQDVLDDARSYVRRKGLARYCDDVLLPALALGAADMRAGRIGRRQDENMRRLLVDLVEPLARRARGRRLPSLTEANMGRQLRSMREACVGPAQGALDVPARSIVLCAGLDTESDEVLTELLVRALRDRHLDARSEIVGSRAAGPRFENPELVSNVLVAYPDQHDFPDWCEACKTLRARLPHAPIAAVRAPDGVHAAIPPEADISSHVDLVLNSFSEAVTFASESSAGSKERGGASARSDHRDRIPTNS